MRAGRLIAMLFALQDTGRMTAAALAARLEVSERTVLRDVTELSQAGVPIRATPGAGGGIELLEGFRLGLTTLTLLEAQVLPIAGQPRLAAALGLGVPAQSAHGTLLSSLSPQQRAAARELDSWFVHDPWPPDHCNPDHPDQPARLREVARAIRHSVHLRVHPNHRGEGHPDPLRPLGLVLQAGRWVLVHLAATPDGPTPTVLPLPEPLGPCTLGRPFQRPDFDLTRWWQTRSPDTSAETQGPEPERGQPASS